MLHLGGVAASPEVGEAQAKQVLASGAAFDMFVRLVEAQGGDTSVLHFPEQRAHASAAEVLLAPDSAHGYVAEQDALQLGHAAVALGAGRLHKDDSIDLTAGMRLHVKPGDAVEPGQPLVTMFTKKTAELPELKARILAAFRFSESAPASKPLLIDRYADGAWERSSA